MDQVPPNASVSVLGGSVPCDGAQHNRTVQVVVDADAPKGMQDFQIKGTMPSGGTCTTAGSVEIPGVESVVWKEASVQNTPFDTCPNNGDLRIFPGKQSPTDAQAAIRRQVVVEAQISPAIADCTVEFRLWDVDDPFDQNNPAMTNVGLIDNDTSGPDNRLPAGVNDPAIGATTATTDANGVAQVTEIEVSMNPGNNYRAAASLAAGLLATVTQTNADANSPPPEVKFTKMLTIWRKLWVETDSMARPTFAQNTVSTSWNDPRFVNGTLVLDVLDQDNDDDFTNGFIRIKATGFPDIVTRIITYTQTAFDDEISTNISVATWGGRPNSGNCDFSDDDLAVQVTFTAGVVGSDIGTGNPPTGSLPLADTTGLATHYAPAYIEPDFSLTEHTSLGSIPFQKNIENIEEKAAWTPILPLRGLPVSTADYWTAYVYSAFQAERDEDLDGETTGTKGISTHKEFFGWVPTQSGFGLAYTSMSAIFVESLDDGYSALAHRITLAHEIAHGLGIDHSSGLMHKDTQTNQFSAESLVELREYEKP
ncbi:MAG TPA: hypothetical protein PKN33_20130 [Phycisphaerae bacterium]|nr:hypothetical protein [Phycisphaerae bacterium]